MGLVPPLSFAEVGQWANQSRTKENISNKDICRDNSAVKYGRNSFISYYTKDFAININVPVDSRHAPVLASYYTVSFLELVELIAWKFW